MIILENARKPKSLFYRLTNKEINIYPASPIQTIPSKQVDEEMFLLVKVFHQIKEGIFKFQYQHFTTFNELLDLDNENQ